MSYNDGIYTSFFIFHIVEIADYNPFPLFHKGGQGVWPVFRGAFGGFLNPKIKKILKYDKKILKHDKKIPKYDKKISK